MRKSPQLQAHTNPPGQRDLLTKEALNGRDFQPMVDIHFENTTADQLGLRGKDTGSGFRILKVPYTYGKNGTQSIIIDDEWLIDLSIGTITLETHIGGLIDGLSLVASTDYCLFAFFDPFDPDNNKFKGFGVTARPQTTASAVSSGTLGSEATFTVPTNESHRFNINARVICTQGTAIGDDYNQGRVTEIVSSTSIKIQLDDSYGALDETNTDLSDSGINIIQTNFFAPKMDNADNTLYPGSGVEYAYKFIGLIQMDGNTDLVNFARPGQRVYTGITLIYDKTSTSAATKLCYSRMIPISTNRIYLQVALDFTAGTNGKVALTLKSGTNTMFLTDDYRFAAGGAVALMQDLIEVDLNLSDNTNTVTSTISGDQTGRIRLITRGYTLYE